RPATCEEADVSEKSTTVKAVGYYRVSTTKQEASIDEQREWARRAAVSHGLDVLREFADEGIPGSETEKRSGLTDLMRFCEDRGDISAVGVWDMDRFSRANSIKTNALIDRLQDAGVVRFLTAEGWIDLEEEVDLLMHNVKQDFARAAFSKSIAKNV